MSPPSHYGVPRATIQTATRGEQLIKGARPDLVESDADDLRRIATLLDNEIAPLLRDATVPIWSGQAADAYDVSRDNLRRMTVGCADALFAAAGAMETYAGVVRWAYAQADDAIDAYRARGPGLGGLRDAVQDQTAAVAEANNAVEAADQELAVALSKLSAFLPSPETPAARAMREVGDWWDDLEGWQQILVMASFAAIVAASGGTVAAAIGVAGGATFGLEHAHGAATFTEDPGQATRNYFATTTPTSAALDATETALTFGPGALGGAVVGAGVRHFATDITNNPGAFAERLRDTGDLAGDAGVVDFGAFMRREPIDTTSGTTLQPASVAEEAAAAARVQALPPGPLKAYNEAGEYQASVYGTSERVVTLPDGRTASVDGFSTSHGLVPGDAKLVLKPSSSIYIPESVSPSFAHVAIREMDAVLHTLDEARASMGGSPAIEIVTNNVQSAHARSGYRRVCEDPAMTGDSACPRA